jgi:N-acetyl-1-D-myo-inositol-2-amino-2-deoxy-alpha-D-glucopyranoside deacetylase
MKKRALFVHAHPDDETINNGATMAQMVEDGVAVTLITCTRGEEGEVLVPELSHLASTAEDKLGIHRITELADAMKELGVKDHRFLGEYRDSGMMGTPQNEHPNCFWLADIEEAAKKLAAVIDEIKPQVMVTYDENGGYGHPDHIQTHRVAMRASEIANWEISKIYWNIMPKSVSAKRYGRDESTRK